MNEKNRETDHMDPQGNNTFQDHQFESEIENGNIEGKNTEEEIVDSGSKQADEEGKYGKEIAELKDKYLRLIAEFENYKRRSNKERLELIKIAGQDTMSALLPVLDDFDRAKANADDPDSSEEFSEGVRLVYEKFKKILIQKGLEKMESTGEMFDPELHEAVTEIPAPKEEMKGKIIDTIESGYKLNDKIIRYAKVVVGK
jgi:molecular chaperone GrpE